MSTTTNYDDGFNFMIKYLKGKLALLKQMRNNTTAGVSEKAVLSTEENILKIYAKIMVFINLNPEKREEYEEYIELDNIFDVIQCGDIITQIIYSKGIATFAELIDLNVKKYFKWLKNVSNVSRVERFITAVKMLQFYYDSFVEGSTQTTRDICPDFHLPMVLHGPNQHFHSGSIPTTSSIMNRSIHFDYTNTISSLRKFNPKSSPTKNAPKNFRFSLNNNFNINCISNPEGLNEKFGDGFNNQSSTPTVTQSEDTVALESPHNFCRKETKKLDQCIVCKGYLVLGLKCKDCGVRIHDYCSSKVTVECAAVSGDLLVLCDIKGYDVGNESTTLTALFDENSTDLQSSTHGNSARSSKIYSSRIAAKANAAENTKNQGMFGKIINIFKKPNKNIKTHHRPSMINLSEINQQNRANMRSSMNYLQEKLASRNSQELNYFNTPQPATNYNSNSMVDTRNYRNSSNTSFTRPSTNDSNKTIHDENEENIGTGGFNSSKSQDINNGEGTYTFKKLKTRVSLLSDWLIDISDLKIYDVTRYSRFGVVKRAQWHGEVSMLILNEGLVSREEFNHFRNKIHLLRRTRHENIKLFMGVVANPPTYAILTNLDVGVSLHYIIHQRGNKYSQFNSIPLMIQINNALGYLHSKGVIHGNLNTKSVLVDNKKACLCDFGLVSEKNQLNSIPKSENRRQLKLPHYWVRTQPPEILKLLHPDEPAREVRVYTQATDMYSLGVLWYEMITGSAPFYKSDISTFIYCLCSGFNCKLNFNMIPKEIMEPLLACISRNCDHRINSYDLNPMLFKLEKISDVIDFQANRRTNRWSAHL